MSREVDEYRRPHPPQNAGEMESLLGFLDHQRATLAPASIFSAGIREIFDDAYREAKETRE